jgi:hypothetical protein
MSCSFESDFISSSVSSYYSQVWSIKFLSISYEPTRYSISFSFLLHSLTAWPQQWKIILTEKLLQNIVSKVIIVAERRAD